MGFLHLVVFHPLQILHVLQDLDVRDVHNLEDNVGVDLVIPRCYITVNQSCLSAKGFHTGEGDGLVARVESVEDALVPDLCLGEDSDLGPKKFNPSILQKIHGGFQMGLGAVSCHAGHKWDSCAIYNG